MVTARKNSDKKIKRIIFAFLAILILVVIVNSGCKSWFGLGNQKAVNTTILFDFDANSNTYKVRPVSVETLVDLLGKLPIKLGARKISALSKDGKKLAVISWPKDNSKGGKLLIIDVKKWKTTQTDKQFDAYISKFTFSLDGKRLYWFQASAGQPASNNPSQYQLNSYDIKTGKESVVFEFKKRFIPDRTHLTVSGKYMVVYGLKIASDKSSKGSYIYTVDLRKKKIHSSMKISGLKSGLHKTSKKIKNTTFFDSYKPGLTSDKNKNLMYIAHADKNRFTVVDMLKGKVVKSRLIGKKVSLLRSITEAFMPVASALNGNNKDDQVLPRQKVVALSKDTERIFLTGYGINYSEKKKSNNLNVKYYGLKIVDTSNFSTIAEYKWHVNDLYLSPDNRYLVLKRGFELAASKENGGIYIFDVDAQEKKAYLLKNQSVDVAGFSSNGRYVYVSHIVGAIGGHNIKKSLKVVDLETGKIVAKRMTDGYAGELVIQQ